MRFRWTSICVLFLAATCAQPQEETVPWPTRGWAVSSPDAEGMDEARLAALDRSLSSEHGNIDGMLVIRNGRILYEKQYERDYDTYYEENDQTPGMYNYYDPE